MNCKKCGYPLTENDKFCKNCGEMVTLPIGQEIGNGVVNPQPQPTINNQQVQPTMAPGQPNNNIGVVNNNPTMNNNPNTYSQPVNSTPNVNSQPVTPNINAQPVNNNPNAYGQPMNNTPNMYNQAPQKNDSNLVKVLILIIAIGAIIAVLFATGVFGGKSNNTSSNTGQQTVATSSTYKVNFKGITLELTDDLLYEINEYNELCIGDNAGTWIVYLDISNVSYNTIKTKKDLIIPNLKKSGHEVNNLKQATYNGVEIISVEVGANGGKGFIAYASADSSKSFSMIVQNIDNTHDYNDLNKVGKILKTAKSASTSNAIKSNGHIDLSLLEEAIK